MTQKKITKKEIFVIKHSLIESTQVEEKTVGQFTGLIDKHGKEIYEGDVLQIYKHSDETNKREKHSVSEVIFHFGAFKILSKLLQSWMDFEHLARPGESYKVIGNIYENPELIK